MLVAQFIIFKYLCPCYTFLNDRSRKWTTNRKTGKKGTKDICRPTGNKLLWGKKIHNESDITFYQHLMRGPSEIHTNSFPADSRPNWNFSFLKERRNLTDHFERKKRKSDYVWGITEFQLQWHTYIDMLMVIHLHIIPILTYFVSVLNFLYKKSTNIFSVASLLCFYKIITLLTLWLDPKIWLVILISGCYTFYGALVLRQFLIIPRAQMASESIAHLAFGLMGYWLRGHVGERNNCFSKIQLVGQKYQDKTTLAS